MWKDIDIIEKIQRRFTENIHELKDFTYIQRLRKLSALTLPNRRTFADVLHVYTWCTVI